MAFETAWKFSKQWEGGYVNDPKDPGGETNYGISKRAHPEVDIKALTEEAAKAIYIRKYWEPVGGPTLAIRDAVCAFDCCVNCGLARTAIWLDGCDNWRDLMKYREKHYDTIVQRNPKLQKFRKGWQNRLNALHKYIIALEGSPEETGPK